MFRNFEKDVIRALVGDALERDVLERVLSSKEIDEDWSGAGYFLTVADSGLSMKRLVFDSPNIVGTGAGVDVGFVVFVMNAELTLECFGYADEFPNNFRENEAVLTVNAQPLTV